MPHELDLTDQQLRILRHMLGIDKPHERRPKPYRNYFAANPGDEEMLALERLGAVEKCRSADDASPYDYYRCTEDGKQAAIESHKQIRHPKGKRKYHKYLDLSDAIPDLTFKQFLTDPQFKEIREAA